MNTLYKFFNNIYHYRYLIFQMTKREISQRYRGSALGIVWSFLIPLLMLIVYTFVFSVVFKARWGDQSVEENQINFAITLFSGLIVFNLFADLVSRAPTLILGNVNYVKKVIFPLEILPLVSLGVVLFHSFINLLVLLVVQIIYKGYIPVTALYLPLILLPLLLAGLGASWFLASLTVYIRDVAIATGVFISILLYMSAVFFPISVLPEDFQRLIRLNPLAVVIEESRNALIFGVPPKISELSVLFLLGIGIAISGLLWFQKTRKGFADVL